MKPLRRSEPNPRNFVPSTTEYGGRLHNETLTFIPADTVLRPMRDQMIVEPLDVIHSRILILPPQQKLLRAQVLAIGPGHYPNKYDHREKHKRNNL